MCCWEGRDGSHTHTAEHAEGLGCGCTGEGRWGDAHVCTGRHSAVDAALPALLKPSVQDTPVKPPASQERARERETYISEKREKNEGREREDGDADRDAEGGVGDGAGPRLDHVAAGGQVRFCHHRFSPTCELKYRGARRVRTQAHCIKRTRIVNYKILLLNYRFFDYLDSLR